jgi:hypothetical protein
MDKVGYLTYGTDAAHTRDAIVWNATYADFTAYYGVRPCAPYRPQTKGKVELGRE